MIPQWSVVSKPKMSKKKNATLATRPMQTEISTQSLTYEAKERDSKSIVFFGAFCGFVVMVLLPFPSFGSQSSDDSPSSPLRRVVSKDEKERTNVNSYNYVQNACT